MGTNWTWMRLRSGRSSVALEELIQVHARAFRAMAYGDTRPEVNATFQSARANLLSSIELHTEDPKRSCRRNTAIARNDIFPASWCWEANTSLLNSQLREQLARWRRWIAEVKAGQHDAFMQAQHLHALSHHLIATWDGLRLAARSSQREQAAWSRKSALSALREEILASSSPRRHAAPILPEAWQGRKRDLEADRAFWSEIDDVYLRVRRWNSATPPGWKIQVTSSLFPTLEQLLHAPRPDLQEMFAWLELTANEGLGLYLD
jgi:hypothetical protein